MNFNSQVFAEILQVVDSPEPDPNTGRITIPPVLQGVFVPGSISRPDVAGGTRSDSHFAGTAQTVANAGQSNSTMTTLREGIWRITGSYHWSASGEAAPTQSFVRLNQGGALLGSIVTWFAQIGTALQGTFFVDTQVTLDRDTDVISQVGGNGVGERKTVAVALHFQRIA